MHLFNVEKYQLPKPADVDWTRTIENLGIFMSCYKASRERVGVSRLPKLNDHFSLSRNELDEHKKFEGSVYYQEYLELHELFIIGYSAIVHPFRPELTTRRKQIFMLRYLYGMPISLVSERVHYQKNIILADSKDAVLQFTHALDLLVLNG